MARIFLKVKDIVVSKCNLVLKPLKISIRVFIFLWPYY